MSDDIVTGYVPADRNEQPPKDVTAAARMRRYRQRTKAGGQALGTTRTVAAARKVLDSIEADDIRIRAREILAELIEEDG